MNAKQVLHRIRKRFKTDEEENVCHIADDVTAGGAAAFASFATSLKDFESSLSTTIK